MPEVILEASRFGISEAVKIDHSGTPLEILDKNLVVFVELESRTAGIPAAEEYIN